MTAALEDLVCRLKAAGRITADDVLALRAEVYGASDIAPAALEALAALETSPGERAPEWTELLAEAMVDFVVRQERPADYVDEAKADWLMRAFVGDIQASGLEALVRVLEAATAAPPKLALFALGQAKGALCGKGHLTAADVALLRRLVFASGGDGDLAISRAEADALFDILEGVRGAFNDVSWPDFFAAAVGASILAASPYRPQTADAAADDEAWLGERETTGAFVSRMAARPDPLGALHEVLRPFADAENEWRERDAAFETAQSAAGDITDDEARWLVARLGHGRLSEPERRLLAFLKAEAGAVSPLLKPLLDAAGAKPAPFEAPIEPEPPSGQEPATDHGARIDLAAPIQPEPPPPAASANEPVAVFGQRKSPAA